MSSQALYRFYDSDGVLLYVGISKSWTDRLVQHRRDKVWFGHVARVDVAYYKDRDAVLDAEQEAIRRERPVHNIVHNNLTTDRRADRLIYRRKRGGLQVGTHVAIGLADGRCPVGEVVAVDDFVTLRLKDWLTGYYEGPLRCIPVSQVQDVELADEDFNGNVWDENLANFQACWTASLGADRAWIRNAP